MRKSIYLSIFFIYLSISLSGQLINSNEIKKVTSIQRNASYNLEEIKVRWKKAALENCTGVPCIIIPPPPPPPSFNCGTSTISDIDGNSYNTVLIGTQCWTKENLKVTKYNDNTLISLNASGGSAGTSGTWAVTTGAYAIYGNQSSTGANATNYGFLYNWYAASDSRKLCPAGWHVPTDGEWTTLIQFIVPTETVSATVIGTQSPNAGTLMKKNDGSFWTGTNTSGFSALPGGYRHPASGNFIAIRSICYFYSITEHTTPTQALGRTLNVFDGSVFRGNYPKSTGASVRCLRD